MPSQPPQTKFYEKVENARLWRDISREYEEFMGYDVQLWPERQVAFVTVLNDLLVRLRENTPTGFG